MAHEITGGKRIAWAGREMPVVHKLAKRFSVARPFEGKRITCCLHLTTETANLAVALQSGGAQVALCASNPLSTQDDVVAWLNTQEGIEAHGVRGDTREDYYARIDRALSFRPHLVIDDGADLVTRVHTLFPEMADGIVAGLEETTTGVIRLRAMAEDNELPFPMIAVNDADTKHLFDNRYGTGQSTLDGILRATNILLSGKTFVVAGYGWCGRGIAMRAQGMGAKVVVTEIDAVKALEAHADGFQVAPMKEVIRQADIVVTVTGCKDVVTVEMLQEAKEGVLLANSGHFDCEIAVAHLQEVAGEGVPVRNEVKAYTLPNGPTIHLISEGRLVNLAAAEGHPASVMDLSFATQALTSVWAIQNAGSLRPNGKNSVVEVPDSVVDEVATLKLEASGISIDTLTPEQVAYLTGWEEGTS
ncbi:adenosylhomocysteinase [bacterium]|nr:adenosylhomocysteinase [bacterium]